MGDSDRNHRLLGVARMDGSVAGRADRDERAIADPPAAGVKGVALWKSTVLAVGALVFVLGLALATMTGLGGLLQAVDPHRHFDTFYALHNEVVVGCLVAMCVLWMLPPHPWARWVVCEQV